MTLYIYAILLVSMLTGHSDTVKKRGRKTFNAMTAVADNCCNMSHSKSNKVCIKGRSVSNV